MSRRPRYEHGDTVWVDRGAGVQLEGQVMHYRGNGMYEVGVAGQGLQVVEERAMSRRPRKDYGAEPESE